MTNKFHFKLMVHAWIFHLDICWFILWSHVTSQLISYVQAKMHMSLYH